MTKTENKVIAWAGEKGIYRESTPLDQASKAAEEIVELIKELNRIEIVEKREGKPIERIIEIGHLGEKALMEAGDVLVCMVNVCRMLGSNIEMAMDVAYEKIKDRKGEMKNGFFVKYEV